MDEPKINGRILDGLVRLRAFGIALQGLPFDDEIACAVDENNTIDAAIDYIDKRIQYDTFCLEKRKAANN